MVREIRFVFISILLKVFIPAVKTSGAG